MTLPAAAIAITPAGAQAAVVTVAQILPVAAIAIGPASPVTVTITPA